MRTASVWNRIALLAIAAFLSSSTLLLAQAGSLDSSFGTAGLVTTAFGGEDSTVLNAAVLQSDGKIVVAGSIPNSQGFGELGLARYNTDGSLDSTFGAGGTVTTSADVAFGIAIQSNGQIVVGGAAALSVQAVRYNTNGTLDTSFGTSGIASVRPFSPDVFVASSGGMALQPDGKILVAAGNALVRFLSNGQVDSSFGTGGVVPLVATANSIKLLPSGKILIASSFNSLTPAPSGTIARYNSNGTLDTTFALNGQISTLGPASAMLLLSSGKFIVGGAFPTGIGVPPAANSYGMALTRFNPTGTVDASFGIHGGVVTPFVGNTDAAAFALGVQSNGDIVAAGQAGSQAPDGPSTFAVARYSSSGQIDTSFGTNGTVITAFDRNTDFASVVLIQSDGKIAVAGNSEVINSFGQIFDSFALARYLSQ